MGYISYMSYMRCMSERSPNFRRHRCDALSLFNACNLFNLFNSLLALVLFVTVPLRAQPAAAKPTFHSSLKTASEAAAADQSLVLLIFSAEWCGPCKLLKKNSLAAKEFTDGGGALRVTDVDIDADEKTARRFEVNAVPTLVLLTADGKIVSRRTGYLSAADLLSWIEEGRRRAKAGQWEGT